VNYSERHLAETASILREINTDSIESMVDLLVELKEGGGRLFFLGVGGSAANCGHAVNDFRKILNIEAYAPTDNVAELTARVNDEGWETVFSEWLKVSRLSNKDMLFVFSVGGGDPLRNISSNIVEALKYGSKIGCKILGVVGRDGGFTGKVSSACVVIPTVNPETITPHSEAFQSIVWHLIVSHPKLKGMSTKWESITL
jgi:D-sedoheptulose 7-phosphate isomerase